MVVVGTSLWIHFCGDDRAIEASLLESLMRAGVESLRFADRKPHVHGVICFSDTEDAVSLLGVLGGNPLSRILALATRPSVLRGESSWRLLQAGAADVLTWSTGSVVAGQIKSRLDRWAVVDQLVESDAVRQRLAGESPLWCGLVRRIVEAARFTRAPVLLIGESGTGKELLAQLIHLFGNPSVNQPSKKCHLITLDCTTIVPELSGSELYGHERGAFTGAFNSREGAFALADGGTLFLDEVGEMPLSQQAQLLRAVQEKTYKRVGGNVWQSTDFRLVCATNRNLLEAAARGEFRLDLYYRIASLVFHTPPLRERRDDILPLARYFLKTLLGESEVGFETSVSEYLVNRQYEGNVRDLFQLIQRIVHRHVGPGPITVGDIPEEDRPKQGELPRAWQENLKEAIAQAIKLGAKLQPISRYATETAIRQAVEAEHGNLQQAARRLGITDRALQLRRASGAFRT